LRLRILRLRLSVGRLSVFEEYCDGRSCRREQLLFYFTASCFEKQVAWKIGRGTEFESRLRDLAQGVGEFTCCTDSKKQDFAASAEDPIKLAETKGSKRFIKSRNDAYCFSTASH
jgi:hypothetical protein